MIYLLSKHLDLVLQRILLASERLLVDALYCHNVLGIKPILGHINLRKCAAVSGRRASKRESELKIERNKMSGLAHTRSEQIHTLTITGGAQSVRFSWVSRLPATGFC